MTIEFIVMNELGSAGICDGKEFILIAEENDEQRNTGCGQVYGDFTDGEQLSIFTQWKSANHSIQGEK